MRDKNKIAILFNKPGVFSGYEDIVSAHIQLPLQTAKLLQENSSEFIVITTQVHNNQVLPNIFEKISTDSLHFVPDLNKQGNRSAALEGQIGGIKFLNTFRYLFAVIALIKNNNINVLNVFGTKKFLILALLFKGFCPKLKVVWTTENRYIKSSKLTEYIISKFVSAIITTTEYVSSSFESVSSVKLVHPGIARNFVIENDKVKNRVLFWRDPSYENGGDIALTLFKKMSKEYDGIIFTFAVRPHWNSLVSKDDCDDLNIEFYETPYKNEITMDSLLSESICVLFPFRELSTNPQLAVIETLNAGIPVICSSVESNKEMLSKVDLDFGLSDNIAEYELRLREFLDMYLETKELYDSKINDIDKHYNWNNYLISCLDIYND